MFSVEFSARGPVILFNPLDLAWSPSQWYRFAAIYLVLSVPFFLAGSCIGLALRRYGANIPRLYAADLVGAGAGAACVVLVLQVTGQPIGAASVWLQMASPMTAIDELAPRRGWHGSTTITRQHWAAIGLTVVVGALVWLLAIAKARGEAAREGLRS